MLEVKPNTQKIRKKDNRHFMHPWEDLGNFGNNERTVSTTGEGHY